MKTNPLEDVCVAKGTTLGNPTTPLFVIQTEMRTYIGASIESCRSMLVERQDTSAINAAGPASWDLRCYVARLFEQIGFFDDGGDDAA